MSDSSRMNAYFRKPSRLEYDPADQEARRREYRKILKADCPHGPRVRITASSAGSWAAGLKCPAGSPNCGIKWLSAAQVYQEWAAQPDSSPAEDGA
jgi:hypothetical protein